MYTIQNSRKTLAYDPPPVRIMPRQRSLVSVPEFRGANATAQTITDRAWIIAGPYETGKTVAALYRLDSEARRVAGGQFALVRKVRNDMDGTVLVTWRRIIAMRGGVVVYGGERPQWYDYPNGARVWVGGLDRPEKTLSGERDGIYINQAEELDEADWELLTRSTTGRGAKTDTPMLWGDCNPGPADHWILRRQQTGALTLLVSRHEDNPRLYDRAGNLTEQGAASMADLDRLTGIRYQRGRLGRWVGAEGMYYTQLDEQQHLVDLPRVPAGWPAWGSLDYGWSHPLSFGIFCHDPAGRVFLVAHHARHKWTIPQHDAHMTALTQRMGVSRRGFVVYAGHDCWAEGHDDAETIAQKFARCGWRLVRATIDRINGARAIGERLGNPACTPPVPPTLFFAAQTRPVFDTLARMVHDPHDQEDVRKVDADGSGRGGDDDYDMLRYGVMAAGAGTPFFQHRYDMRESV